MPDHDGGRLAGHGNVVAITIPPGSRKPRQGGGFLDNPRENRMVVFAISCWGEANPYVLVDALAR